MFDSRICVATIVREHSECAAVFARYRIDYCCKGKTPLAEACSERGLDVKHILTELDTAVARRRPKNANRDPRTMTTKEVIATLIAPHHQYLHRTMPFVQELAAKVAHVHGDYEPSLHDVARIVDTLVANLTDHMAEEEGVLFPALLQDRIDAARPLLLDMRREHEAVGAMLELLHTAAADYVTPVWACNSYKTLMRELEHMEADLIEHIHIENDVLLPRYVPDAGT
jgi:regulator of cell morphogenesis and NO signaling